jgi:hypothetical protein
MFGGQLGVAGAAREVLRVDDRFLCLDRKFIEIHGFASH